MTEFERHRCDRDSDAGTPGARSDATDQGIMYRHFCPMAGMAHSASRQVDEEPADRPLSDVLRERTRRLHATAERSGIIADILQRKADRGGYALLLRNLLPAYERLEAELSGRAAHPVLGVFAHRSLRRSDRLRSDLHNIAGAGWARSLPLLESGIAYAAGIAQAASGDGLRLVSHAYVRYLGDLSGGQVLKKLLGRSLSLPASALTVYDFPRTDTQTLKVELRDALDHAGRITDDLHMLVIEAMTAFEHNIVVSRAVREEIPRIVPHSRENAETRKFAGYLPSRVACQIR